MTTYQRLIPTSYNRFVQANPEVLEHMLSQAGHRITQPRKAVIEALCQVRHSLDANELLERAKKIHAGVGLATVYRTLDMLEQIGVVRKMQLDGSYHVVACGKSLDSLSPHLREMPQCDRACGRPAGAGEDRRPARLQSQAGAH